MGFSNWKTDKPLSSHEFAFRRSKAKTAGLLDRKVRYFKNPSACLHAVKVPDIRPQSGVGFL